MYVIERELGGGGMSRVFLAEEVRFHRRVVVKLLSPELAAALSADRFEREIELAAGLQQANIVPVITAGSAGGLPWYTMPYVEGESLRARLTEGPVPLATSLQILRDVARALAYAHDHGIVHRDIKPENVLLSGGAAVVTDFGIAKAVSLSQRQATGETLTAVGTSLGTPAYMAPEQAAADPATDHRADLYAWGVVAYELLSGVHPFASRTSPQQLMAAHFAETPPPLTGSRARIPVRLAALVMRTLEKQPARRPSSAHELLAALEAAETGEGGRDGWRRPAIVAVGVALIVVAALGWRRASQRSGASGEHGDPHRRTLAVLPFENVGGDSTQQYFSEGLSDELTTAVARIPDLQVASRSAAFSGKLRGLTAQEAGRALRVTTVLEGSVRRAGARIRLSARLINVADGLSVWSDEFEHDGTDVFAAQDDLTTRVTSALHDRLAVAPVAGPRLARGTNNPAAYDLYLRGRYFFARRGDANLRRAAVLFEEAIREDSTFARAYASLAMVQSVQPMFIASGPYEGLSLAIANARRALALDSRVEDAHLAIGSALTSRWEWAESERHFKAALALDPSNATAHQWYGDLLLAVGRIPESLTEMREARRLDPYSAVIAIELSYALYAARQFRPSIEVGRQALALDSTLAVAYPNFAMSLAFSGHPDTTVVFLRRALRMDRSVPMARGQLVYALVTTGQRRSADSLLAAVTRDADAGEVSAYEAAVAHAGAGDRDGALRWLARSVESHAAEPAVWFMICDPLLEPLRPDPRFASLVRRMGLTTCRLE
jgi:serine/threonine-protein kinase